MAIKFSLEQQLAIDSTGQNIIVSAGAGSGKTAVLTERIKIILLSGVKANQLLVLTFTNAAAAEMKERISKKMAEDDRLKARTAEVDSAYITTFDSFSLSIVKRYHERLNLTNNISIIDASILNVYKRKVIDEIFLNKYELHDELFERTIYDLTPKDDEMIKKEVLSLANKLDLLSDTNKYLNEYISSYYNNEKFASFLNELENILLEKISFIKNCCGKIKNEISDEQFKKYMEALQPLFDSCEYNQIRNNMKVKLPAYRNLSVNATIFKNDIKTTLDDIEALCIFTNKEYMEEAYFQSENYTKCIIELIQEFNDKIMKYKISNESFEFIDIAKMAIKLVKENEDIRKELSDNFVEILIDEYQDTNDIQEEFISYISKDNVYMVGDIKQSIYGFRNANPLIFKEKYDSYRDGNKGMKIDLNQNFRSNRAVLHIINKVFNHIMDDQIGQANFEKEHQMRFGLTGYDKGRNDLKIKYVSYIKDKEKYKTKDVDMFYVVEDIKKKIKNKEEVYDKDTGNFRPCDYKDFAILVADSSLFDSLSQLLSFNNIPNLLFKNVDVNKGTIVSIIKNLLKLVSLDSKEIYDEEFLRAFYGVGRSFLFNMCDEELFDFIKDKTYKESKLYKIVNKYSNKINSLSLFDLTTSLLDEINIYSKIITLGEVEDNITRVEFLLKTISSMEQLNLTIFEFVDYMDDIFKNQEKMEFPASGIGDNKVNIMTIHKSKGLEFPIVYFINNDKIFNKAENKDKFIFDNKYGIISPYYIQGEGRNVNYILMKERNNDALISEKIRLLYVALTRAREQIIIINSVKENGVPLYLLEDIVPVIKRKKYNSFSAVYNSIVDVFSDCKEELDPLTLNINDDYLKGLKLDVRQLINYVDDKIDEKKIIDNSKEKEQSKASKEEKSLLNQKEKENMEYGTYVHELLEMCDFKNVDYSLYNEKEKRIIKSFLSNFDLESLEKSKILKEYEFIYEKEEMVIHGVIDLMIVYDDRIDIIDYKLSNINDEAYVNQLSVYKHYIETKTNKPINVFLYSIINNKLQKMGV